MTENLPPEVEAGLREALDNGVYLRRSSKDLPRRLGWKPGTPNPLAEFIIAYADRRCELDLNGHKFWIEPQKTEDGVARSV